MAGLTKAQKAEKKQKEAAEAALAAAVLASGLTQEAFDALSDEDKAAFFVAPAEDEEDGLIAMVKDDDELRVHPTCVKAHESAGWKVGE